MPLNFAVFFLVKNKNKNLDVGMNSGFLGLQSSMKAEMKKYIIIYNQTLRDGKIIDTKLISNESVDGNRIL